MAVYAIGDLQGCLDPLQHLLERIQFDPSRDRLWFVGDLVNRGPQSLEALRFVRALGDCAVSVLGNHDLHLLAAAWTDSRRRRKRDTLQPVLDAPDREELLDWLRRRPMMHHDAELDFTLVHAGLPPQWDLEEALAAAAELEAVLGGEGCIDFLQQMYGNEPARWDPRLRGVDRLRFIVNALTRVRYLRPDGALDLDSKGSLERSREGLIPWFDFPGRRTAGLRMVFGHWSMLGENVHQGAYSIDTGCVYGGRLTALQLDAAVPTSVDCGPALWDPRDG